MNLDEHRDIKVVCRRAEAKLTISRSLLLGQLTVSLEHTHPRSIQSELKTKRAKIDCETIYVRTFDMHKMSVLEGDDKM